MQNAHLYLLCGPCCIFASVSPSIYLSIWYLPVCPGRSARSALLETRNIRGGEHKSQCCQNGITTSDKHDTRLSIDISRLFPLCCTQPVTLFHLLFFIFEFRNADEHAAIWFMSEFKRAPYSLYVFIFFLAGFSRFLSLISGRLSSINVSVVKFQFHTETTSTLPIANCQLSLLSLSLAPIEGLTSLLGQGSSSIASQRKFWS